MSDLISRKHLLELANREGAHGYVDVKQILDAPTAYDPNKVVEQIHEYFRKEMEAVCISAGDEIPMGEINHLMKANKNVCRIVKKGGVE